MVNRVQSTSKVITNSHLWIKKVLSQVRRKKVSTHRYAPNVEVQSNWSNFCCIYAVRIQKHRFYLSRHEKEITIWPPDGTKYSLPEI